MRARWVIRGLKIAALAILAGAVFGFVLMSLWNWLAPELFGWRPIGFLQAAGVLILCRLLVGGFRGRGGGHLHWRARLAEKLDKMTPEEREKFRAGLRARCGWHPASENESEGHGPAT